MCGGAHGALVVAYDAVSRVLAAHGAQAAKAVEDRQQAHDQLDAEITVTKAAKVAEHEAAVGNLALPPHSRQSRRTFNPYLPPTSRS